MTSSQYSQIAPELIRVFIKVLEEGEPQFIAEPAAQVSGSSTMAHYVFGILDIDTLGVMRV